MMDAWHSHASVRPRHGPKSVSRRQVRLTLRRGSRYEGTSICGQGVVPVIAAVGRHALNASPVGSVVVGVRVSGLLLLIRAECLFVCADATPAEANTIAATTTAVILPVISTSIFCVVETGH
jgi:hypothetical protein